MHQVGLLEVWVFPVNSIWIRAEGTDVLLLVPAHGLIRHCEHQEQELVHIYALWFWPGLGSSRYRTVPQDSWLNTKLLLEPQCCSKILDCDDLIQHLELGKMIGNCNPIVGYV